MATTIKSPIEGHDGVSAYGPLVLEFKGGEATTDQKLTEGHKAYFKANGYKVSGTRAAAEPAKDETKEPAK